MILVLLLVFASALLGQQPSQRVTQQPDCLGFFTLTTTSPTGGNVDNRTNGCNFWAVSYNNFASGFSALTFTVQSASNNAGGTAPASYGTFNGTVVTGANPATATTEAYAELTGYNPWVRVQISGLTGTGTVQGTLYGWKSMPSSTATIIGTADTNIAEWGGVATSLGQKAMAASVPVVIASNQSAISVTATGAAASGAAVSGNPVLIAGSDGTDAQTIATTTAGNLRNKPATQDFAYVDGASNTQPVFQGDDAGDTVATTPSYPMKFNGATWDRDFTCTSSAVIDTSASGATEIIALSGSTVIRICSFVVSSASAVNVQIVEGTGSDCGTGTANLTGAFRSVTSVALDTGGAPRSAAGSAVCISLGSAVATGGVVTYAQY